MEVSKQTSSTICQLVWCWLSGCKSDSCCIFHVYPLSFSFIQSACEQTRWLDERVNQQISAQFGSAQVRLEFRCPPWRRRKSLTISLICCMSLRLICPLCTGKAQSIDFIRHRSVGLSVCLSCIPDIPKPPPTRLVSAFSARAAPTVQRSPITVNVTAVKRYQYLH